MLRPCGHVWLVLHLLILNRWWVSPENQHSKVAKIIYLEPFESIKRLWNEGSYKGCKKSFNSRAAKRLDMMHQVNQGVFVVWDHSLHYRNIYIQQQTQILHLVTSSFFCRKKKIHSNGQFFFLFLWSKGHKQSCWCHQNIMFGNSSLKQLYI